MENLVARAPKLTWEAEQSQTLHQKVELTNAWVLCTSPTKNVNFWRLRVKNRAKLLLKNAKNITKMLRRTKMLPEALLLRPSHNPLKRRERRKFWF